MTQVEVKNLLRDIDELRSAVRKNNPLFRELLRSRFLSWMSLPFAVMVILSFGGAQILVDRAGSFAALSSGWKLAFWAALALFFLAGAIFKLRFFSRRAAQIEKGATLWTVLGAMYGGSLFHIVVPSLLIGVAGAAFAVSIAHPWYGVPLFTILYGIIFNSLGTVIDRREVLASGWYSVLSGLTALFFVESAPFFWTAVMMGGMLLVYGLVGLLAHGDEAER